MMRKKAIDLFCGGGGGDHGIESIGFKSVFGVDFEPSAIAIRRHAFPESESLLADFFEIKDQAFDFDGVSLAIVGFPCTTFSLAGKRKGVSVKEGQLALAFPEFLARHQIPFLLGENVTGLLSSGEVYGLDYLKILAELDRQGYWGAAGVINARHYVPQNRKRIYVLAIHRKYLEKYQQLIEENEVHPLIQFNAPWLRDGVLANLANVFWRKNSQLNPQSVKTINLEKWRNRWEDFPGVAEGQLKFVSWCNGKLIACDADFKNAPYCSQTVKDCLLPDGLAFKYKSSKGEAVYTKAFPTLRGLNGDAGSGAWKVVTEQGDRVVQPIEAEKAMGWPVDSTDADVSTIARMRALSKGMVPGAIADLGTVFSNLIGYKSPLKWAGGKRWFAEEFRQIWKHHYHRRYFDPFCGGLSLFFAVQPRSAYLADVNDRLINFWKYCAQGFQIEPGFLQNDEVYYYEIRKQFNASKLTDNPQWFAAAFYYFNRAGRSGLCRTNSKGEFNTPYGKYSDAELQRQIQTDFREFVPVFKGALISNLGFKDSFEWLRGDDFLLLDPPYYGTFTDYSGRFDFDDQVQLAKLAATHPGPVILFNSDSPEIVDLYQSLGFSLQYRQVARNINSSKTKRPPAIELIAFRNLEI